MFVMAVMAQKSDKGIEFQRLAEGPFTTKPFMIGTYPATGSWMRNQNLEIGSW
jgi:hypothetical protein